MVGLLFCVMLFGFSKQIEAVKPQIWKQNSQSAFESGDVSGLSLTQDGTVKLGPKWDVVADTGENFVWSLASDANGTVYIGTGIEGRIYALKKGGQPTLLFDAEEETKIFALTVGPDGALYAGTSPSGLIYRIAPGKAPELFCETGDLHVWSLMWHQGKLYATTGGEVGRILRVAKNKVETIYQSQDPNIVSLTAQAGVLYAGTDQSGLIYKVSSDGAVSVFYDAGEKEVHALAIGRGGMVYAAAMASRSDGKQNGNDKGGQSVLYAIRPSGSALRLWEVDDPLLLSVTVEANGHLLAVTGKKGRIYRILPDGRYTLLAQLKDVHPWAVLPSSDGSLLIGSSGDGQVFEVGASYFSEGILTSDVKDFTLVSQWGQAHWHGGLPAGTSVSLQTRSGNSEEPDDTWSDWSGELKKTGEHITSRPARFLQYRLHLKSSSEKVSPFVREIRLSGMQENIAPMVLSVSVDQGDENGDPQRDRRSFWRVSWEAGDVNDDQLIYTLYFREVGTTPWLLLKDDVSGAPFVWDTETVPDGKVEVRVVASDRKSNPLSGALMGEAVSAPFEIDNMAPVVNLKSVRQAGGGQVTVVGEIEDQTSAVVMAKYAINSGDWQVVFAEDKIFDSAKEMLNFTIPNLKPGFYTLVVSAEDAVGNVGVGKTTFEVK